LWLQFLRLAKAAMLNKDAQQLSGLKLPALASSFGLEQFELTINERATESETAREREREAYKVKEREL